MILVDANLLIYAVNRDSPHHGRARAWLEETLSSDEWVGLAPLVLLAFLRIVTRAGIFERPLSHEEAIAYCDSWLAQPNVRLVPIGPNHWHVLRGLLQASGTAGNLTSDAHLAAIAIESGSSLASADNDFKRFAGLDHGNPLVGCNT